MNKQKVIFNGSEYDYYIDENGYEILEQIDSDGFKTSLKFKNTKTEEEVVNNLLKIISVGERS